MYKYLKIKKTLKIKKQRFLRFNYIKTFKHLKLNKFIAKNIKISILNRYLTFIKKNKIKTHLQSVCTIYGRSYVSKKFNMGRFALQSFLNRGKFNSLRSY